MFQLSTAQLDRVVEGRLVRGARDATRFFMGSSDVHQVLERLAKRLQDLEIPYAILGAMALNAYGYRRTTEDVDVLLRCEGLEAFKKTWLGRGYVEKFPGVFEMSQPQRKGGHGVEMKW